ncbi:MAG: hypothetical protein H7Y33_16665 [Cytophagales bacterium]|nr:hypothetical protein [Rhizobacter sp.]
MVFLRTGMRARNVALMVVASLLASGCGGGGSDAVVGAPPIGNDKHPEATITLPASGATFKAGDAVSTSSDSSA